MATTALTVTLTSKTAVHLKNIQNSHRQFVSIRNLPEVLNVHMNEREKKIYFFRRIFFQAVKN